MARECCSQAPASITAWDPQLTESNEDEAWRSRIRGVKERTQRSPPTTTKLRRGGSDGMVVVARNGVAGKASETHLVSVHLCDDQVSSWLHRGGRSLVLPVYLSQPFGAVSPEGLSSTWRVVLMKVTRVDSQRKALEYRMVTAVVLFHDFFTKA